jgi:Cu2+-exporting ATPase
MARTPWSRHTRPSPAEALTGVGQDGGARASSGPFGHCPHCGTAVEGPGDGYCCHGCEVAAAIIRGAGLERYYRDRTAFAPRPEPAGGGDWSVVPVQTDPAGHCEARLVIDGLRCASCVWVTEKVLERTPGVDGAMVSYATGRATVRWDPNRVDLPTLARRIASLGYRPRPLGEETPPDRTLLFRLGYAVFAAIYLMGFYEGLYAGWWYGRMDPGYAALFRWASLALATPVALWCADPFFAGAWSGLRNRVLHMDLPIALGVVVLYVHGFIATLRHQDAYLDSLGMLVALLLAGRVLESRGRRRATEAASALVGSLPRTARRLRQGCLETVPVETLRPGDRLDVGAGEELAADGRVVEGSGQVRMALVTGEATPALVGPGDAVVAGTLLADGALTIEIDAVGDGTVVHRMATELQTAQDRGMAPTSADRIAPWFTAATLILAALTFLGWWIGSGLEPAISNTVAVLVVACPCGLALAQPLTAAAGLGAAARRGLLLRSSDALLQLARVDLVALDKTGTVTLGATSVTAADDATLRIAAGLERYSVHPIALAITSEAAARGIPLPSAGGVVETPGHGVRGEIDGRSWELRSAGPSEVLLSDGLGDERRIRLGDSSRPDAPTTVAALHRLGLRTVLLTGDHSAVAESVARTAGVADVAARVTPQAKADWIRQRQRHGHRVLFVGDGLNDGPALAAADVGIAMSGGAASSVLVSDGIVSSPSLGPVLASVRAGRAARRLIRTSQRQSLLYNLVSVSAAAAGLVNPLVAAVLMPLSSGVVIWNAARVERIMRRGE